MDEAPIFAGTQEALSTVLGTAKKAPRKPRPSELAKKAAKSRTKLLKKVKARKPKAAKRLVKKVRKLVIARSERMDLRLTKAEKAKLTAKAKATRRTITSVVVELIEKMR